MTRMLIMLSLSAVVACAPTRAEREAAWAADCTARGFTGQTHQLCVMQHEGEQRMAARQSWDRLTNMFEHWQTRDAAAPAYVPMYRR